MESFSVDISTFNNNFEILISFENSNINVYNNVLKLVSIVLYLSGKLQDQNGPFNRFPYCLLPLFCGLVIKILLLMVQHLIRYNIMRH